VVVRFGTPTRGGAKVQRFRCQTRMARRRTSSRRPCSATPSCPRPHTRRLRRARACREAPRGRRAWGPELDRPGSRRPASSLARKPSHACGRNASRHAGR